MAGVQQSARRRSSSWAGVHGSANSSTSIPDVHFVSPREHMSDLNTSTSSDYSAISDSYDVRHTLGEGGFAKVKLAHHKLTGQTCAIKIMSTPVLVRMGQMGRIENEIKALEMLHHRNIAHLFEVKKTDSHIFIVTEVCAGGDLFDFIVDRNRIQESTARSFFRQLVLAVRHCHVNGIAHRDLKPVSMHATLSVRHNPLTLAPLKPGEHPH
jgi:serine/threonine protein kinase